MLRQLCLVALVLTSAYAAESGEESEESITVEEYRKEMSSFVKEIIGAAKKLETVQDMAIKALDDETGEAWQAVGEKYAQNVGEVSETFGEEAHRLTEMSIRLWSAPKGFVQDDLCSATYKLLQHKDQVGWLAASLAFTFISDISCLKEQLEEAEKIELDAMEPGKYRESEALELIYDIFVRMQRIKMAGERFGKSLEILHRETSGSDKRALTRLYRLLSKLDDDKKRK